MSTPSTERYEELAVKAVDGLLTAEEDQELQALPAEDPDRGAELDPPAPPTRDHLKVID